MTDRIDRKVGNVFLAEFVYRHEAEFAAGFLDEAGIPYRLQLDDPAMGMTVSAPATLWVRGMDLQRAREVLDLPEPHAPPARDGMASRRATLEPVTPRRRDAVSQGVAGGVATLVALAPHERTLAFALFVGCLGGIGVALGAPGAPIWVAALTVLGGPLGLGALSGRTLAPVRRILRAISGGAP